MAWAKLWIYHRLILNPPIWPKAIPAPDRTTAARPACGQRRPHLSFARRPARFGRAAQLCPTEPADRFVWLQGSSSPVGGLRRFLLRKPRRSRQEKYARLGKIFIA